MKVVKHCVVNTATLLVLIMVMMSHHVAHACATPQQIQKSIDTIKQKARRCFATARSRSDLAGSGKLFTSFIITQRGGVANPRVTRDTGIGDPSVGKCLINELTALRFPACSDAKEYTYPWIFDVAWNENWWEGKVPCPSGASLHGAAPPQGRDLKCFLPGKVGHGRQTQWYSNRWRKIDFYYWNGAKQGIWRTWYPNGQLKNIGQFVSNQPTGTHAAWFETGVTSRRISYRNGRQHGKLTQWHENSQIKKQSNWSDGIQQGSYRAWHQNGKLQEESSWKKGKRHGPRNQWHENGQKMSESNYSQGLKHGRITAWYPDGKPKSEISYLLGKKHGKWVLYTKDGKLLKTEMYNEGVLKRTETHQH